MIYDLPGAKNDLQPDGNPEVITLIEIKLTGERPFTDIILSEDIHQKVASFKFLNNYESLEGNSYTINFQL